MLFDAVPIPAKKLLIIGGKGKNSAKARGLMTRVSAAPPASVKLSPVVSAIPSPKTPLMLTPAVPERLPPTVPAVLRPPVV